MVTVDLNAAPKWEDVFRRVEAGEMVRVMRGNELVALVQPSKGAVADEEGLNALSELGLRQLAEVTADEDFSDWK